MATSPSHQEQQVDSKWLEKASLELEEQAWSLAQEKSAAETSQEPQFSRASEGAEAASLTVPRSPCPLHSLSCNRGWKEGKCTGVKDMTSKEPEHQEAHQA